MAIGVEKKTFIGYLGAVPPNPTGKNFTSGTVLTDSAADIQAMKSRIIYDIAVEAVQAKRNHEAYLGVCTEISDHLARESNSRKDARGTLLKSNTAALVKAFERMDIEDARIGGCTRIVCPGKRDVDALDVWFRDKKAIVFMREPVMAPLNPVSEAESAIVCCIADIEPRIDKQYLGVKAPDLVQRGVVFISQEGDSDRYAYLVRGASQPPQSIFVPSAISGEELLFYIDKKIIEAHLEWHRSGTWVAFPLSFIETQAERIRMDFYKDGTEPGSGRIKRVLEYLAQNTSIPVELVPIEYRDALHTLRSLSTKHSITRSRSEMTDMWSALDYLDSPALRDVMAELQGSLIENQGKLNAAQIAQLNLRLGDAEKASSEICGEALTNLAKAYGALSGDDSLDRADAQEISRKHAGIMLGIRSKLEQLAESGYIWMNEE